VPANTEGGGVAVEVGKACVGNGVIVGGTGGGGAAQAVSTIKNKRKGWSRLFIVHSLS
jgi:hypothetical protein